ncbi:MAG TPA: efflux RND transporter permease subunit [Myxococcota bacterium]|nr:efflux RND transporter permease subunit [Myxococcota bacterium]
MNITEICIRRPVLAWMMMAATITFGVVAATRIGISQFPDVDFPNISVSLTWEGAAPEVMEHDVVELVEEALVQVEGVRSISSSSKQGSANITIELDISRDVDLALQDVQTKIASVGTRLPRDMDPPVVSKTNPEDQPIMWIGLAGPYSEHFLSDFARYRLKEKLQTVPGIGEIMMGGYLERNVRIWLDASRLAARGLTVGDVVAALDREHVELPAGRLEGEGRELNVRVLGEALDLETFRRIVVREVDGSPVYREDDSLVEDGFEDVRRVARVDGERSMGLGVKKQRGANAVAVAAEVKKALDEMRPTMPPGLDINIIFDSTQFISDSVREIELEIILAVFLTALVCWMFLGSLSSTFNVILAIPMSLFGTIAVIYFLGYTLNTFTLLGLGLAVGIVVDDAIMVMENIFRHAEAGADRVRAASEGTRQITFAALAATVAVVAIFIPVIFMKGAVGRFFVQFGVALCVAVLLSYVEAVTLAPARCAQLLAVGRQGRNALGRAVDRGFAAIERLYTRVLAWSLRRPLAVLAAAAAIFAGSVYTLTRLPAEFVPSQDQSRLLVRITTAVGSSLPETDALFRKAEAVVNGRPEVTRAFAVIGGGFGGSGVNAGVMFITLVPPDKRTVTQNEFAATLRKEMNAIPGVRAVVQDLSQAGFTGQRGFPVEFSVRGPDWEELVAASDAMRTKLAESGVVVDVDTDYQVGMPELRITPDRARAADLGVPIEEVATTVNALVGGMRVGKYSAGGRRLDVRMRLLAEERRTPDDLGRLYVRGRSGDLVPLSSLVSTVETPALQAIYRKDRERAISIYANVAPGHSQDEALALVEKLAKDLPLGYRAVLGGASVQFRESFSSLLFALALGIIFAYMVLASQFNSLLHPVTVLTVLPLSVAGAAAALWATGTSLNVFSMIGLLLLMGIVKKNSIILVDYAGQARAEGASAREAMQRAGPVRLRPILMTSIATLMAAVPPALGLGPGSEIRAPMAVAVLGGVFVSTALSLMVVPAFYVVADGGVAWVGRVFGRKKAAPVSAAGEAAAAVVGATSTAAAAATAAAAPPVVKEGGAPAPR